jgi:divalent metal cation (Fe/Co/Zn/Cd) transporter
VSAGLPTVIVAAAPGIGSAERERLERRANRLAWAGVAWHVIEFAVAIAAGMAASSIALIGFGVDSLIEVAAGLVVVWRFTGRRRRSHSAERRAHRMIGASFLLLAAYVGVESVRTLAGGAHPEPSVAGILLALVTAATMPLLARAKRRVGRRLDSAAAVSESSQTVLCAYLSVALLIGLGANAALGWWWADPLAALAICAVAVREGIDGFSGTPESCC